MADTINFDVSNDDDGVDAFLSSFGGEEEKKAPSTKPAETEATEPEEHDAPETETEETETDDADGETDPDDTEVEIKVGEETKKATLRDLKRLYGQEASLTQKSQALAQQRAAADASLTQATTALKTMSERATAAYEPYAKLDWLVLAQRMDTETFQALRQDAAAAEANVKFYETELTGVVAKQQEQAQLAYREAADACRQALEHPDTGIKGFGPAMYEELMQFADKRGVSGFRQGVRPEAIKILHAAMLWDQQQSKAKVAEQKIAAAPNKPSTTLKPGTTKTGKTNTAMQQLRRSGAVEDAADAFEASFRPRR